MGQSAAHGEAVAQVADPGHQGQFEGHTGGGMAEIGSAEGIQLMGTPGHLAGRVYAAARPQARGRGPCGSPTGATLRWRFPPRRAGVRAPHPAASA